jgi:hypothetical protein
MKAISALHGWQPRSSTQGHSPNSRTFDNYPINIFQLVIVAFYEKNASDFMFIRSHLTFLIFDTLTDSSQNTTYNT